MKIKLAFLRNHWAIFNQILNVSLYSSYKLMKIHQHNSGHMTKMAAMPIYDKNTLKIFFPGTTGPILMSLCMKHHGPKPFIFCSYYDPGFTFTASSNFATSAFIWENVTIMDSLEIFHPVTWNLVNIVN